MMNDGKTFTVAMIGIPEQERKVLKNIFKLSLYRTYTYTLISVEESSQILIVDKDDPTALAEWHALRNKAAKLQTGAAQSRIPAVLVSKDPPASGVAHYLRRPFIATRVFGVLDLLAAQTPSAAPERVIGEESASANSASAEPPTPTALVVDDSNTVRKQLELELQLLGVQVNAVESGEQAFEALAQNDYELIFLDVVLPGIDGYQICKIIKKDRARKKTPIIMLTSKSSPFDRVKGTLAGCDTYLTKPVTQSTFQKTVRKYLKLS